MGLVVNQLTRRVELTGTVALSSAIDKCEKAEDALEGGFSPQQEKLCRMGSRSQEQESVP